MGANVTADEVIGSVCAIVLMVNEMPARKVAPLEVGILTLKPACKQNDKKASGFSFQFIKKALQKEGFAQI